MKTDEPAERRARIERWPGHTFHVVPAIHEGARRDGALYAAIEKSNGVGSISDLASSS
jgi:hypothetical protein